MLLRTITCLFPSIPNLFWCMLYSRYVNARNFKPIARPSASLDDSDLDYLDSQVLSADSDPDYLDSQVLSKTILSEPAVQSTPVSERAIQSTPVSVPAPVPPKRYKGYVYVPVEELVSNETQPTNTNPENGKPQRQRRLPKKCLEFVYD